MDSQAVAAKPSETTAELDPTPEAELQKLRFKSSGRIRVAGWVAAEESEERFDPARAK